MGPRLFRRGNAFTDVEKKHSKNMLQWGHAFSDVEIPPMD